MSLTIDAVDCMTDAMHDLRKRRIAIELRSQQIPISAIAERIGADRHTIARWIAEGTACIDARERLDALELERAELRRIAARKPRR
jgi:hypothetical protein